MSIENPDDTAHGFDRAPDRYSTSSGREAIDLIRDRAFARAEQWLGLREGDPVSPDEVRLLANFIFAEHCSSTALKYELRRGKKGDADRDGRKANWYRQMAAHALWGGDEVPDPRHGRVDSETGESLFVPYERQPWATMAPAQVTLSSPEDAEDYLVGLRSVARLSPPMLGRDWRALAYRRRDVGSGGPRTAVETFREGGGDIEDLAVAAVAAEKANGVEVVIELVEAQVPLARGNARTWTLQLRYPDGSVELVDPAGRSK